MWSYSYFALRNDRDTTRWTLISKELFDAQQLLKTTEPAALALAAHATIGRFEHATGVTPGVGPETLCTRAEADAPDTPPSTASAYTSPLTTATTESS
ncbi:hypothetical protein ACIQPR_45255 [Streptomyces sp. NPDC091280]|uniref:hypothetical protein n=1 Tax=Streptomyces sp. NPDC091280 TaxID=3365984 RepID=UPI003807F2D3